MTTQQHRQEITSASSAIQEPLRALTGEEEGLGTEKYEAGGGEPASLFFFQDSTNSPESQEDTYGDSVCQWPEELLCEPKQWDETLQRMLDHPEQVQEQIAHLPEPVCMLAMRGNLMREFKNTTNPLEYGVMTSLRP